MLKQFLKIVKFSARNVPNTVGGLADGPAHSDAGFAGAHPPGELVHGLEQRLPSQSRGVHGGGGGHGCGGENSVVCR